MMDRRQALLALALAAALPAAWAQADKWPEKPVRIVVGFAAGGGTDALARLLAQRLSEDLGQQFIVENRAGAGGSIAAEQVARAAPDGYTAIFVPSSYAASSNPALYKLSYDPVKGIAPIALSVTLPLVMVVHPSVKAASVKDVVELLRANPKSLAFGSSGQGGTPHLSVELFQQMTKTAMVHVPYKGIAPALTDLLAGRLQMAFFDPPAVTSHIRAGKLRALAVTTAKRQSVLPDLPPIGDTVPGYDVTSWYGMWAPGGTPRDIVVKFNQALGRIMQRPEIHERLRAEGTEPAHSSPEEFGRLIERDIALWGNVIRTGNIKAE